MGLGHVLTHRRVAAFKEGANVTGNPFVLVKALDGVVRDPHIQLLLDQLIDQLQVLLLVHID